MNMKVGNKFKAQIHPREREGGGGRPRSEKIPFIEIRKTCNLTTELKRIQIYTVVWN